MTNAIQLSILLPAYNEEANIQGAVSENIAAAESLGLPYEIVAINDGSADETGTLLENLRSRYAPLRVVTHPTNRGLGEALQSGLQAASGEFCIVSPADSPHDAQTLRKFYEAAQDADVVLGYRVEKPGYSALMWFNSRLFHWMLRIVCGLRYRDVTWIHFYRRSIFQRLDVQFGGIVMAAEVVLKAHALGYRIREIHCPMRQRQAGRASASRFKVMVRTGRDLLKLLWQWRFGTLRSQLGKGILVG